MPTALAKPSWKVRDQGAPRARRVRVAAEAQLIGDARYDYADAFEIRMSEADERSAEQFARCALEQASWPVRLAVAIAQRKLLRLRLSPHRSPEHLAGWTIRAAERDMIHLEAVSPLLRGVIVGRRVGPTRTAITTYVFFTRPVLARLVWTIVAPLHRRVAARLLEQAAVSGGRAEPRAGALSA
jgi:hypothetical protein